MPRPGVEPLIMTREELRYHIDSAAPGAGSDSSRLEALILGAFRPGSPEDRSERVAVEWLGQWHPERFAAQLPTCSCATGRCVLCN
jgi:hypothetical protein